MRPIGPIASSTVTAFLHGFLPPFSLILATIRDPALRVPYLRLAFVRGAIVILIGALAIANGSLSASRKPPRNGVVVTSSKQQHLHVDVAGFRVDIDPEQAVPKAEPPPPQSALARSWAWVLTLVAALSAIEGVIVFLSRRWDDWLSFHASRLAMVRPEEETPKQPRVAFDLRWLYRKGKRRVRGYVVLAAGLPALLPLRLIPTVGVWLFTILLSAWGWYWLGVFTAAKSAHACADEGWSRRSASTHGSGRGSRTA